MNTGYRIYVEKKTPFQVEAKSLREELNENLSLGLKKLRLLNVYDLFGFTPELLERSRYAVFGEVVTDCVTNYIPEEPGLEGGAIDLQKARYVAVEYLPGQFDQRAASAVDCIRLLDPKAEVHIKSSRLYILDEDLDPEKIEKIRRYLINPVEAREKDLSALSDTSYAPVVPVKTLEGFVSMKDEDIEAFLKDAGLAMNKEDLKVVIDYFKAEGREPNETELRILDTYWSDHCRHTTFTTRLTKTGVEESFIKKDIEASLDLYMKMRSELKREEKPVCLMDLATIGARYLKKKGLLDDLEESEENNACSIYVDVDNDGLKERWLLMFKNETHNHPTEIEPFGGAATCLGGAIRDPLSGRSYVYQAMRVTGAGNIWEPVAETRPGKLPQKVISRKAAHGYSSYGNQIGLATTHVREIFHKGYTAKRMEIGAVVGAVKASDVRRESPAPGDVVLLLGGRTGRDGIGGATGSSKQHTEASLETCGSEVQKGNAPEERKLQRLFRRPEVTKIIKKSNDFGAGGVSVAIGELADGLDIWLDRVPTKYSGLNSTEIAISESQERMAVVIDAGDVDLFKDYCRQENVEATHVADVTDTHRMRMYYKGEPVVDLKRDFINSAGAERYAEALIESVDDHNPFEAEKTDMPFGQRLMTWMSEPGVCSQRGLVEMFDSTIGRSTVLMPFGGMLQTTETQVSVQKLPVEGYTDTASIMAFGYDPYISEWSPYHGAAYAVVEACAKVVAAGGSYEKMRFSYQEYFERMTEDPHAWGKPLSALLGALKIQEALGLPSIGGKDSMSGTFEDMNVPPTLVAFGITTVNAGRVISPEFKWEGNFIYLIKHKPLPNYMPDTELLKKNWSFIEKEIGSGNIVSGFAVGTFGASEAICKMAFGNAFGVDVKLEDTDLFGGAPGSIVVECEKELSYPGAVLLGQVVSGDNGKLRINGKTADLFELMDANENSFDKVYPLLSEADFRRVTPPGLEGVKPFKAKKIDLKYKGEKVEKPLVFIPVFPGTNCDYDTAKAFRKEGAEIRFGVFCNLTEQDVLRSIQEMKKNISECHILALSGGFSAGDEPDGSGKFIANVLNNKDISEEIHKLLDRDGLILGICNGFQALVKSGLLPYGRLGEVNAGSPTLFRNDINRHVSQMVTTKVASVNSPWLSGMTIGDEFTVPVSHGEGKFVVSEELAKELFANGQVAFQYMDPLSGEITMKAPYNPNGSYYAIEGIISKDGKILGKMGHSERYENNLFKNIEEDLEQPIFANAVKYFRGK